MLEAEPEGQPAPDIPLFSVSGVYAVVLAGTMFLFFIRWEGLWTIGMVAGHGLWAMEHRTMNQTLKSPLVVSVLNRLLQTLCRSLALYAEEIKPWSLAGHEPIWTAIGRLAADSRMYCQRVAEAIITHGGQPNPGPYPLEFAALNDLGLDFFLREIIVHLKRDQKVIGECAAELPDATDVRSLAEEAYGNLRGHIELLESVAAAL